MAERTVYCEDAIAWLEKSGTIPDASLVSSMPDFSEFPHSTLEEWKTWFMKTAGLILKSAPDHGVVIFYQTDIKKFGTWVDKAFLCQKAAEESGHALLWHKLVCRVPPGAVTFGRPAYAHLLCFSRGVRADLSRCTMDVLPETGEVPWSRGMGEKVCRFICEFIRSHTETRKVVNPFCGYGSVLAAANALGMEAVGIELSRRRAGKARLLGLSESQSSSPD